MTTEPPYQPGERILSGSLFRRIPNWQNFYLPAAVPPRPTGFAFDPDRDEQYTSMALASVTTPEEVLSDYPDFGLCVVRVETFPNGVHATYEPEHGAGHVAVWGLKAGKGAERLRRALALRAEVIRSPRLPLLSRRST